MLNFASDYAKGVHPEILKALTETNNDSFGGYSFDPITERANEKIKKACACPEADIYYLVGGTQVNSTVIATMLKPFEGVVAAKTGQ